METLFPVITLVNLALALAAFVGARLSVRWPQVKWVVIGISVYLSGLYFLWRYLYTLNTSGPMGLFISLSLVLAETYGFIAALLFYFQTMSPREEECPVIENGDFPSVDILITIYNESPEILYRTVVACMAIEYPRKKLYVCDDGQRQEIRELTERLGCNYIRGPRNEDAKAGNLNHALKVTQGELILTLDVDHIPVRSFLQETAGFFRDPRVALVQTAHHFYNPDIFQRNLRVEEVSSNEQDMFFHVVQPGRNRWNSSFYCGSGAILRRSALEETGGFRTETLTEDIHTSIYLHSLGYRSVYVNKDLAAGLAPEDFESYAKQRTRWARGCFQVFLRDNPLLVRGLKPSQRICYFASVFYFLHGPPRLVFLVAPLTFLLFHYHPLVTGIPNLITFYFPHLIATLSVLPAITKVFRKAFWADIYETVMCLPLTGALFGVLWNSRARHFAVTPKGLRRTSSSMKLGRAWWLMGLGLLTAFAMWKGSFELVRGSREPEALIINIVWSVYNFFILVSAVLTAYERPQLRSMPRLERRIPCKIRLEDGSEIDTTTRDLSETGLSIDLQGIYSISSKVDVELIGKSETTKLRGELIRFDRKRTRRAPSVGIRFPDLTEKEHQAIIRQMYCDPDTWAGAHDQMEAGAFRSLWKIGTSAVRVRTALRPMQRRSLRYGLGNDCRVQVAGESRSGKLLDVGGGGLAIELERPIEETVQELTVILPDLAGGESAVRCKPVYVRGSLGGVRVGVRVLDPAALPKWITATRKANGNPTGPDDTSNS